MALNRLLAFSDRKTMKMLFRSKRAVVWLIIPVAAAVYSTYERPAVYDARSFAYLLHSQGDYSANSLSMVSIERQMHSALRQNGATRIHFDGALGKQ